MRDAAEEILTACGPEIRLAAPLGLGKPNTLLNALYARVKADSRLKLTIHTALSLNPPRPAGDLARRFFGPFRARQWGEDYPELDYARDAEAGRLPPNIRVQEFYFTAGAALHAPGLQREYQSVNYTRVAETVLQNDVQVLVQLIARSFSGGRARYSLSCNPDVTLDLVELYRERGRPLLVVGVIHPDLPFLAGDAEVEARYFDILVDDSEVRHRLFALPRMPIGEAEHAIGFYASQLVPDGGTLQIGIGALSDAVAAALLVRQQNTALYLRLFGLSWKGRPIPAELHLECKPFILGIYGLSEMVTDCYMHLRRAGILKRCVVDDRSGTKTYLHGAFFLGSEQLYAWLRGLGGDDASGLRMTRVSKVNDLYDPHETALRRQRTGARFLNTCMQATLLGAAASETLEDGRVVSGVGGQYNFVAMAGELRGARSVLMLRSARVERGRRRSNIVWSHGQLTIPRHLRDVVVTEYGIADLRGKSDAETIEAMLCVADSEFQEGLVREAKGYGKLAPDYRLPEWARHNTPEKVRALVAAGASEGAFGLFAVGSDFTRDEEHLVAALGLLRRLVGDRRLGARFKLAVWALRGFVASLTRAPGGPLERYRGALSRMGFDRPTPLRSKLASLPLLTALRETEAVAARPEVATS